MGPPCQAMGSFEGEMRSLIEKSKVVTSVYERTLENSNINPCKRDVASKRARKTIPKKNIRSSPGLGFFINPMSEREYCAKTQTPTEKIGTIYVIPKGIKKYRTGNQTTKNEAREMSKRAGIRE